MPFQSQAQRGYLYANKPEIAKEFEKKTPKAQKLPEKAPSPERRKIAMMNLGRSY